MTSSESGSSKSSAIKVGQEIYGNRTTMFTVRSNRCPDHGVTEGRALRRLAAQEDGLDGTGTSYRTERRSGGRVGWVGQGNTNWRRLFSCSPSFPTGPSGPGPAVAALSLLRRYKMGVDFRLQGKGARGAPRGIGVVNLRQSP